MKPTTFPESNLLIAEDQPLYLNLPAYKKTPTDIEMTTCWRGNFWDRLRFLFTGRMWVYILNFNGPVQPLMLETENPWG